MLNNKYIKGFIGVICLWSLFLCLACSGYNKDAVDRLNDISYSYHYKSLDSAYVYAQRAKMLSGNYSSGIAESLNNLAFVNIAKMDYSLAKAQLDSVFSVSNNQIELLIADIQLMRLCQRQAHNKEFYDYREHALNRLRRIHSSHETISGRLRKRLAYAESEYSFVCSTYYYYVGLYEQSRKSLAEIRKIEVLQGDTAQYLNWLYMYGSGSMIVHGTKDEILQQEYEKLLECYLISKKNGYVYWEANSLQSLSEHIMDKENLDDIAANNPISIRYFNTYNMSDSLFAGYLAQQSADMFHKYGDVYQVAGSLRTLAQCFWNIGDNRSALICLKKALDTSEINQAPDLIASIHELLSLVYSSMNDKYDSDINRNIYLDLQEKTRQDMELDARAAKLQYTLSIMNIMIIVIVFLIVVFILLSIYVLKYRSKFNIDNTQIMETYHKWKEGISVKNNMLDELNEELEEAIVLEKLNIEKTKRRNVEDCAKVSLVDSILPLIDRMKSEVEKLLHRKETDNMRSFRYGYIAELSQTIGEYNSVLTQWIQLREGEIGIHVESFPLNDLFDIVKRSKTIFDINGIELCVEKTNLTVKADKILTLFMLNTIADNARKYTRKGGKVKIWAEEKICDKCIEISVSDTGEGMTSDELADVFKRKIANGHGFGLINCSGILKKYKKISSIFKCCDISAESVKGKGSRFFFRLPIGMTKLIFVCVILYFSSFGNTYARNNKDTESYLVLSRSYTDSLYHSNIEGNYEKALLYADSAITYLNIYYKNCYSDKRYLMKIYDESADEPAEIKWFKSGVNIDYSVILTVRNECAVASLALHKWKMYGYNNDIYTILFKEVSADNSLAEYCRVMQRSEINKNIAIVILIIMFIGFVVVAYVIYYRHVVRLNSLKELQHKLLDCISSNDSISVKKKRIEDISNYKFANEYKDIIDMLIDSFSDFQNRLDEQRKKKNTLNDDLRQLKYENERLYVCNNILENCLSTIKHETMYYPARIYHYVNDLNDVEIDMKTVGNMVSYYKELYTMLCEQIHRQMNAIKRVYTAVDLSCYLSSKSIVVVYGDKTIFSYMFDLLRKQNNGRKPEYEIQYSSNMYVHIIVKMYEIIITDEECRSIFTPNASHIPFLICRQIIRDIGYNANRCGCGITAMVSEEGKLEMCIILPTVKNHTLSI